VCQREGSILGEGKGIAFSICMFRIYFILFVFLFIGMRCRVCVCVGGWVGGGVCLFDCLPVCVGDIVRLGVMSEGLVVCKVCSVRERGREFYCFFCLPVLYLFIGYLCILV